MNDKVIAKHTPLSLDDMRTGGTDRLTIITEGDKCAASFRCYDDSVVECSGAKKQCSGVEAQDYIVGVSCQGDVKLCSPMFPDVPEDIPYGQVIACKNKAHKDPCSWRDNGILYSGFCRYKPLDPVGQLSCSETSYGT